ncbi:hypothetical protein C8A01DRAFT_44068 [Parachaetomium inaequale]|uniref:Heterokaryon incompatibility domain-containing protein n=1 Tax=Parachaetomium inaequale TaxID=2588326 RepID=A0AAN6PL92_9PEZI|nr:hypothetical protein C8A01DRAFT_44068 [Parachaetomium inaequale]
MRLLNVGTFKLEEFFGLDPPPYAVLSHTWGSDSEEVSYRDVLGGRLDSASTRPPKVTGCCKQAQVDGYKYVWIDTCCIDKTNSVELQEAINSMFRWYRDAAICYAYLSDVPSGDSLHDAESAFSSSRWFQRGWTLQELLAPLNLRFYDAGWSCLGTKGDLCDLVETVTGIPTPFLVAQRMSWAAKRVTKRTEDIAYCLLGIFGVSMPMIYGEGDKAFRRLQEQIMKDLADDSILAWDVDLEVTAPKNTTNVTFGSALAPAPSSFANSGQITMMDHAAHSSFEVHGGSLRLSVALHPAPSGQFLGLLRCRYGRNKGKVVGITLAATQGGHPDKYFRPDGSRAILLLKPAPGPPAPLVYIQLDGGRKAPHVAEARWFHIRKSVANLELIDVHPTSCWHKERALIEAAVEPSADGVQRILARFRETTENGADFVAVLEIDVLADPCCNLMVASRKTSLEEIASRSDAWREIISDTTCAYNGSLSLYMALESLPASTSHQSYILKPWKSSAIPHASINATTTLQLSGAAALLGDLREIDEVQKTEAKELRIRMRDRKQKLAEQQVELEKMRASIVRLELEERRMIDEHAREHKLEIDLREKCARAKTAEVDTWDKISGMERLIEFYNAGEEGPENGDALAKSAEQILPFAVERGHDSFARLLIDRAASVSVSDLEGRTALHHAVRRGQEELVQLLIHKGAHVDTWDTSGETPLHAAAERGFAGITSLLLKKHAKATKRNNAVDTPLDLALRGGRTQAGMLLQLHEARQLDAERRQPKPGLRRRKSPSPSPRRLDGRGEGA